MKKIRYHLILSIALFAVLIVFGITYAWYINGKMTKSPIIQSEDIEGINLYLYRGNDYDFNGSLESRDIAEDYDLTDSNVVTQLNKDLNKVFFSLDGFNDKITGIMDNNIATYRLRVVNDTDKEYHLNPYFVFGSSDSVSPYNSMLFRLRDLNIYNHTFLDKDTNFIDYFGETKSGDNYTDHFNLTSTDYYKYDISSGLYDTYNNPITLITNGYTYFELGYEVQNGQNICISVKKDGVDTNIIDTDAAKIVLSEYYNSTVYDASNNKVSVFDTNTTHYYDTFYSDSDYLCHMEYNYINQGGRSAKISDIGAGVSYNANLYYPSRRYDINTNLSLLMYHEKFKENEIVIDSFSEYYIDYHFVVDSNLSSLNQALDTFASAHGITNTTQVLDKDPSNCNDYELAYKGMYAKYSEMLTYSEIRKPNFKIESFCFDMVLVNKYSSYVKKRGKLGETS